MMPGGSGETDERAEGANATGASAAEGTEDMIDLGFVERLIALVEASGVHEMEIEREGTRIRVAKPPVAVAAQPLVAAPASVAPAPVASADAPAESSDDAGRHFVEVTAPMVGTFYCAPSPNAPAYVAKGSSVEVGDTLCIIEAMKLMNELEAEVAGTVVEVCLENGKPVEYGQVLFRIDPD